VLKSPDPCEQDDPYEKDKFEPSRFRWGPDGHCYSETSYHFGIMNISCAAGEHPVETTIPAGLGTGGIYIPPHPWYDCVPGVSYEHRLTRDEWEMRSFYRAPDGKISTGKTAEKEYWERCAAASNCYTMGGPNVNGLQISQPNDSISGYAVGMGTRDHPPTSAPEKDDAR
jgi:hypothetical protein